MAAALRLCGGTTASSSGPALPELTPFAIQASPPPPSKSAPIAAATTMAPQPRPAAAMTPWASSMAFASAIASHLFAPFRKVQPPLAPMPMGHRRVVWQVDVRQQQPATQSMSALHSDAAAAFPRQATAPRELLQQTAIRPTSLVARDAAAAEGRCIGAASPGTQAFVTRAAAVAAGGTHGGIGH